MRHLPCPAPVKARNRCRRWTIRAVYEHFAHCSVPVCVCTPVTNRGRRDTGEKASHNRYSQPSCRFRSSGVLIVFYLESYDPFIKQQVKWFDKNTYCIAHILKKRHTYVCQRTYLVETETTPMEGVKPQSTWSHKEQSRGGKGTFHWISPGIAEVKCA